MKILAPKAGVVTVTVNQPTAVKQGDRLAEFQTQEEELQIAKIGALLRYIDQIMGFLDTFDTPGSSRLRQQSMSDYDIKTKALAPLAALTDTRSQEATLARSLDPAAKEAAAMLARAQFRLKDAAVDQQELFISLDSSRELLTSLQSHLRLQNCHVTTFKNRLAINSPFDGHAQPKVENRQYVKVGSVLFEIS